MHPAIPYVHTDNSEEQPIIRVKIGSGTADLVVDTGAWFDEVSAELSLREHNRRRQSTNVACVVQPSNDQEEV